MIIKQSDYNRIFNVINSVLLQEDAKREVACMYFSTFAAFILEEQYNLTANVVGGLAAYHLGENNNVLVFGDLQDGVVSGNQNGYHFWVEVDGWLLDFMAPIFPKILEKNNETFSCSAKMLQKPLDQMASSIDSLNKAGDFLTIPNAELTEEKLKHLTTSPLFGDLAEMCNGWFKKPPKKMQMEIGMHNGDGNVKRVPLHATQLRGAW